MTDPVGNLYFYNSTTNEVTKHSEQITYDQFKQNHNDENSFWSGARDDLRFEMYAMDDEMLCINERPGQTEEMTVILFATLLGLRDTAAEE